MSGQTVKPTKIKKSSAFLSCHGRLVFTLLFVAFNMLWTIQFKNEVAPLEVSIFQKLAKTVCQNFG